ncbi:MAG: hypothetical protein AAGN35_10360 [Bacteroidota bacterium]
MGNQSLSLHFKTEKVYEGFAQMEGVMTTTEQGLRMEYVIKDNFIGVLKGNKKSILIPYGAIAEVDYKRNLFVSRFRISVNDMEVLGKFPGAKNGRLSLKVMRRNKDMALRMQEHLRWRLGYVTIERGSDVDPFLGP